MYNTYVRIYIIFQIFIFLVHEIRHYYSSRGGQKQCFISKKLRVAYASIDFAFSTFSYKNSCLRSSIIYYIAPSSKYFSRLWLVY